MAAHTLTHTKLILILEIYLQASVALVCSTILGSVSFSLTNIHDMRRYNKRPEMRCSFKEVDRSSGTWI